MSKSENVAASTVAVPTLKEVGIGRGPQPEQKIVVRKACPAKGGGDKIRRCHRRELKWFAARGWRQDPPAQGKA